MEKNLIIDVSGSSVSIALLENGRLMEYNAQTDSGRSFSVGDVYLGKVRKLLPSLNAAFVDIGDEKEAFIHYLDLGFHFDAFTRFVQQIKPSSNFANLYTSIKAEEPLEKEGKISDHLKVGQPILAQIIKEPISTKGSRLTSEISIAGRNIVLMPFSNKVSVSQKISSKAEKQRLERLIKSILPHNYGAIIRTAAEGKRAAILDAEVKYLIEKWESSWKKMASSKDVQLLFTESSRTMTTIRDLLNDSFTNIYINDSQVCDEVRNYIAVISPEQEKIVHFYKGAAPIFDYFDVTRQIKGSFGKVVSMKKGAYLVIEHTEAMNVIDVNSGTRIRAEAQEDNALEVNMSAAEEIARQMRLRDMGGITIVDFIDMADGEHRNQLLKHMQQLMETDRARHTILPLTKFGLMQITRQRVRPVTEIDPREVCPVCGGSGKIAPTLLLDDKIESELSWIVSEMGVTKLKLTVNPVTYAYITKGWFNSKCRRWARKYKCSIKVKQKEDMPLTKFRWFDLAKKRTLSPF
ncbi:MAG: Rne/Rng family ribonuclease [Bacteroidales bacterium]|nr:Rne/Rng family ribonuclease [Bacteroidales bacterium]